MHICFTGIDGCGKSTQVTLLKDHFHSRGLDVCVSKAYGEIEKSVFAQYVESIGQEALLFLFQAFHIQQRIKARQAMAQGEIVIADRWDESYLVYHSQCGILAADHELREKLNFIAFNGMIPDFTFLIDLPVEEAYQRVLMRGAEFFDRKPKEYHEMMRMGYLRLAHERHWHILNGDKSIESIHEEVIHILQTAWA